MSQKVSGTCISRAAGADLSAKKYFAVKLNTSNEVILAGANDKDAIGILQNKPAQGETARVQLDGTTPVCVSEAVVAGDRGTPTGDGKLETVDAADEAYLVKFLEAGGGDGEYVEALIERGESNTSDA